MEEKEKGAGSLRGGGALQRGELPSGKFTDEFHQGGILGRAGREKEWQTVPNLK